MLALELEAALHQALDIEFAWEGPFLRILQVRRIPAWRAVWRETALRFPLGAGTLEEASDDPSRRSAQLPRGQALRERSPCAA